jgi:serine/threonine protein kinase
MQQERWRQIESVFHSALERAPHAREAYLNHACKGDISLREEIARLLSLYARSGDPLDQPALDEGLKLLSPGRTLAPGERVGRYEIVSLLGAGGMGEVYLARDPELERRVAIKVLGQVDAADEERVQRLYREGRAASALNHPNILTVYEMGRTQGHPYIATELVEGITLRERLRNGPVSSDEAGRIAIQASSALEASHAAGILHRDIKPENLMLRPDGVLKVLDFGLAQVLRRKPGESTSGTQATVERGMAGTVPYMSPEQVRGDPLDFRTDLWSLGVVLYEMLTGRVPFGYRADDEVSTEIVRNRIQRENPTAVQKLAPNVPAELARIVERCLAKDPTERFRTVSELKSALEEIGSPSVARARRRSILILSLIAALILAIAVIAKRSVHAPLIAPSFEYYVFRA